jgi:hypothetical protein
VCIRTTDQESIPRRIPLCRDIHHRGSIHVSE